MVQYRVWKLMKMMGKATLAIRSMSLSRTPHRVVGAVKGKGDLTTEHELILIFELNISPSVCWKQIHSAIGLLSLHL